MRLANYSWSGTVRRHSYSHQFKTDVDVRLAVKYQTIECLGNHDSDAKDKVDLKK